MGPQGEEVRNDRDLISPAWQSQGQSEDSGRKYIEMAYALEF